MVTSPTQVIPPHEPAHRQPAPALGAVMYRAQWATPFVAAYLLTFGRDLLGQELGWITLIMLTVAVPAIIVLGIIENVLAWRAGENPSRRALPERSAVAAVLQWPIVVLMMLFIGDAGDTWAPDFAAVAVQMGFPELLANLVVLVLALAWAVLAVLHVVFASGARRR